MDKNHSFIFTLEHHYTSTLFSDFSLEIEKCKYFTSVQGSKERINEKMEKNNKSVFSRD